MKILSDTLKILAKKIREIIWILGLNAFTLFLVFVLLDLIIGGFTFYKYVFLAEQEPPKISGGITKFNDKFYQNVLSELQERSQNNLDTTINLPEH